jgi:hypothetical protein
VSDDSRASPSCHRCLRPLGRRAPRGAGQRSLLRRTPAPGLMKRCCGRSFVAPLRSSMSGVPVQTRLTAIATCPGSRPGQCSWCRTRLCGESSGEDQGGSACHPVRRPGVRAAAPMMLVVARRGEVVQASSKAVPVCERQAGSIHAELVDGGPPLVAITSPFLVPLPPAGRSFAVLAWFMLPRSMLARSIARSCFPGSGLPGSGLPGSCWLDDSGSRLSVRGSHSGPSAGWKVGR